MKKKYLILYLILIISTINIISSYVNLSIDITDDKRYSISNEAKKILNELDDVVFIKIYLDGDFPHEFKHLQSEIKNLLMIFKSLAGNNLEFEFINPNLSDDDNEKLALFKQLVKNGLAPTDIQIKTSSSSSQNTVFPGALFYYKNKQIAVNFLKNSIVQSPSENINSSIENLEYEFISALHNLTKKTTHKIAFLEGNGQLSEEELFDISESVLNNNEKLSYYYDVERFNLKEFKTNSKLEPDLELQVSLLSKYKALIIAKPTTPFNNIDKYLIDQYIMQGGKVLWLVDGVNGSMDSLRKNKSFVAQKNDINIDDQLFKYGVRINSNLIEDLRATKIPIVTGFSNNTPQQSLFIWPYFALLSSNSNHPISKGLDAIKCEFVSSLDTVKNNIKKTVLLTSSKQTRLNLTPVKISLGILENPPPINSYNKSQLPVAILLEGKFESVFKNRILPKKNVLKFNESSIKTEMIVVGDGDLIRNKLTKNGRIYPLGYDRFINYTYQGNKKFILNCIHYLCDDIGLTKLKSKVIKIRLLNKQKIKDYKFQIQFFNIILPLLLLIIFSLFFVKHKKKIYAK